MLCLAVLGSVTAMLVCSCGSSGSQQIRLSAPNPAMVADGTAELLRLMNEARSKNRRAILTTDPRLMLAARDHAESMAKHNYFAHRGRDGSHFQIRMQRRGYPQSHSAENLAMAGDAATVFDMWWQSKGHKTNMMNKKYTRVGIARAGNYWTANYAAPDGT
ncbi:MAG: CAP domain-containing protein [Verrucomicrobiae bacterium]|nr:CAP domain-containing protein [Verrucomicrobiae bacterium]NNJ87076.1 CAP domain-containing protein [Akkermansiaceae bacterium]